MVWSVLPTCSMQTECRTRATDYVRVFRMRELGRRGSAWCNSATRIGQCTVLHAAHAQQQQLPLRRDLLGGAEHPERVEARDLPHVRFTPSPAQQLGDQ